MKMLKQRIKKTLPYHFYRNCLVICFIVALVISFAIVGLSFIKTEAVPYQVENQFDYMYIDVQEVVPASESLYLVSDGEYVYVYSDDAGVDKVSTLKRVEGATRVLEDNEYEKILPIFQKMLPELEVQTVEEMTEYIGNTALDHQMTGFGELVISMLALLMGVVILALIVLIVMLINYRKSKKSLKHLEENNEIDKINEQMNHPISIYSKIKIMLLNDYIIVNHSSPFIMNYSDIQWIYIEKTSVLFIADREIKIVAYDKSFKRKVIMRASGLFSKNKLEANQVLNQIASLHSNILVGYTDENKGKYQQIKKGS